MKLDRFKFAQLAAWIGKKSKKELTQEDIGHLDWLTEMPDVQSEVQNNYPANDDIEELMGLMYNSVKKIEAVKLHRKLTGLGLVESKNIVERYWKN